MTDNVIRLPFVADKFDDATLMQIYQNFKRVEMFLGNLQKYMNTAGYDAIGDMRDFMADAIIYGLEVNKPRITESTKDQYKLFYATDTQKLYMAISR